MSRSMFTFPFGKFTGIDVEDVPTWYLEYIIGEQWFEEKFIEGFKAAKVEIEYRERFGEEEKTIDSNWNKK